MELRELRHFVAVAQSLSFTAAADDLGLSQSTLSRSIQSIERRAKVRLFDRDRGGVHLTSVGQKLLQRAVALLREADDLQWDLTRTSKGEIGDIAFGMSPLAAAALAPGAIARGLAEQPQVRNHIWVRTPDALLSLLIAQTIEFFVCAEGQVPENAPVRTKILGRLPSSLIVRAGHPLLASPSPREDAPNYPWIVSRELDQFNILKGPDVPFLSGPPTIVMEDFGSLARITASSDAIWVASRAAAADEIGSGILADLAPLVGWDKHEAKVIVYTLERRTISPSALRLLERFVAQIRHGAD